MKSVTITIMMAAAVVMSLAAGAGSAFAGEPNPAGGAAEGIGTTIWAAPTSTATAAPIDLGSEDEFVVPPDPEPQPEDDAQLPGGNPEGSGGELPAGETAPSDLGGATDEDSWSGGSYSAAGHSASQVSSSSNMTLDAGKRSNQPVATSSSSDNFSNSDADDPQTGDDRWQLMGIGLLLSAISLGAILTLVFFVRRLNTRTPEVS